MTNCHIKQGDCLELMKDIPDGSIDMILCDLPYGTTACKWDVIIPFEPLWEQYHIYRTIWNILHQLQTITLFNMAVRHR